MNTTMEIRLVPAGTVVTIKGIPFELKHPVLVSGAVENFALVDGVEFEPYEPVTVSGKLPDGPE